LKRVFNDWYHGGGEGGETMLVLAESGDVKNSILSEIDLQ